MGTLLQLFTTFLLIGSVSFGGGYAMLPVIEIEVTRNGWMTTQELTDVIAIAGMSPGPIATNTAILVGHATAGVPGAMVSAVGMVLPSFILILIIASFFYKISEKQIVKEAFYGLRPIITGLIIYSAFKFGVSNNILSTSISWHSISMLLILISSLYLLVRQDWHPIYVILLSGLVGIVLY